MASLPPVAWAEPAWGLRATGFGLSPTPSPRHFICHLGDFFGSSHCSFHLLYRIDAMVRVEGEFPVQIGLVLLQLEDILLPPATVFPQGLTGRW